MLNNCRRVRAARFGASRPVGFGVQTHESWISPQEVVNVMYMEWLESRMIWNIN